MVTFTVNTPSNDNVRKTQDTVVPFLLNLSQIRGRMTKMGPVIEEILSYHQYPQAVSHLLGEALLVTGMLATLLEHGGNITLQAKGQGPINFMIVDGTADGKLRGYANVVPGYDFRKIHPGCPLKTLLGEGHLAITVDHTSLQQRYQGLVGIDKGTLAECIEEYFSSSEQLDAKLRLLVGKMHTVVDIQEKDKTRPHWYGGGILIQRKPESADSPEEQEALDNKWEEAKIFVDSITEQELVDPMLGSDQLLYRLFHEDGVWVYDPAPLVAQCRCSREKIVSFLKQMPDYDIEHMKQKGVITVTCEFCNKTETFGEEDLREIRSN